jgi:hypothetical protein
LFLRLMNKIDLKQRMREVKFTTEHTLNEDQRRKLIQDKLERAERFYRSKQVQEERTLQP